MWHCCSETRTWFVWVWVHLALNWQQKISLYTIIRTSWMGRRYTTWMSFLYLWFASWRFERDGRTTRRDHQIATEGKRIIQARSCGESVARRGSQIRRQLYRMSPHLSFPVSFSPGWLYTSQIYTPQGAGVWYGRVTPHDVESIVINTIIGGLVLPPLLRGGVNLSRPGCKTLNDW